MGEADQRSNAGCVLTLAAVLTMLMFYYAVRISGLRTELRDLQRRVGQLESERR